MRTTLYWDPNNNSQVISDPSHIPSILYEHFASVSTKLASKLLRKVIIWIISIIKITWFFLFFFNRPIAPDDVLRQCDVLLLPNNKSYGLYSFPAQCLKCSCDILSPVQSKIFKTSLTFGVHPSNLRSHKITLTLKSEEQTDASNYRPISLFSNCKSIFEKLLY